MVISVTNNVLTCIGLPEGCASIAGGIGIESPLRVRVKHTTVYTTNDPHTFPQCRLYISRARTFLLAAMTTTLRNLLAISATTFL